MTKIKQWVALTVLAVLGIAAAGWFLLVSPKNAEADDLEAQAEQQTSASQRLRNDIKALQAQAKALPRERVKLAAVAAKLPADPGTPALIRALTAAADASGVKFVSLTPGPPAATAAAVAAAPKATASQDATSPTNPDATTPTSAAVAVPTGLMVMPVEISVFGGFYEAQAFAAELEDLPRAFRVKALTIKPGDDPGASGTTNDRAETDGQHLLTVISGEVFMSTVTAPVGATGTVS